MDHTFPVTVVDDTGANVAGAKVALVEKSGLAGEGHPYPSLAATHGDAGSGKYNESSTLTPTGGDWVLVVKLAGKAPVVQPLKLTGGAGGEFKATPAPGAVATVTITSTVRKVGAAKVKEIAFHVTLHPAAELVFIGGVDYSKADVSGGWLFHEYGFKRAEVLRREKKIHPGTIVTVFSTAKLWRTTRVFGVGKWVDIEVEKLGDPSLRTPAIPYVPAAGIDISIVDFYKYISEVGKREAHSVKEVGIFSHSWPGGPILYNSGEAASLRGNNQPRDTDDFDARAKDFNTHNYPKYDKMDAALAADCRFTIWGCSATTHYKFRSREALRAINKGLAETAFFTVRSELQDSHDASVGVFQTEEEHTSEIRHRFMMDSLFRRGTYAAEAARKLKIEVRAGCPGTGSDPTTIDGIEMLMVNLVTYADVFGYFHKKFAPEFAETNGKWDKGYVDYHAIQSRAAVADPGFSTEYYDLTINTKDTRWQTAGATLSFWNRKAVAHPTAKVRVVMTAQKDFAEAGKSGHLYVLEDSDKTKSQAVYVQEDEKVFRVTQNASHKWTVIGAEI